MKPAKYLWMPLAALLLATGATTKQNSPGRVLPYKPALTAPFKAGEYLKYNVSYGIVNVGYAEIEVKNKSKVNGFEAYHIVGYGKSNGFWDMMFKVRDRYETFYDAGNAVPVKFIRDVYEGGYEIKRNIDFDHFAHKATDHHPNPPKTFDVPYNVQDMLSSLYYARGMDTKGMQPGDEIEINLFLDHEMFPFKLKMVGRETVKVKGTKFKCMVFRPVVQKGRVFSEDEGMTIWVTDDANKIPVKLKTSLRVGSISMELDKFKNLNTRTEYYKGKS